LNIRIDSVTLISYRFAIISKIACLPAFIAIADASLALSPSKGGLRP